MNPITSVGYGSAVFSNHSQFGELQRLANKMHAQQISKILRDNIPSTQFVIPREMVERVLNLTGLEIDLFLQEMTQFAKERSSASFLKSGAVALGESGNLYLGINLEFPGFQLNQAVQAEHFCSILAEQQGEQTLTKIAILSHEFNSHGIFSPLLTLKDCPLNLTTLHPKLNIDTFCYQDDLIREALTALQHSYAPYSNSPSSITLEIDGNDTYYSGVYKELTPIFTTLPLQAALVALTAEGYEYSVITRVVLVEKKNTHVSHERTVKELLSSIAPKAYFFTEYID